MSQKVIRKQDAERVVKGIQEWEGRKETPAGAGITVELSNPMDDEKSK